MPPTEEKELIAVTMTAEAAQTFRDALNWFYCRIDEGDEQAIDFGDWLRWGMSRIDAAEFDRA